MVESPLQPQTGPQSHSSSQPQDAARSLREKRLKIIIFFLGPSLCASILGLIYYYYQNVPKENSDVKNTNSVTPCCSLACQKAAARIAISVDPFSRPCDFFFFTCGSDGPSTATRGRQKGEGATQYSHRQKRGVETRRRWRGRMKRETESDESLNRHILPLWYLKEILESESLSSSEAQKASQFYRSCMDVRSIETAGAEPFLALIQKLGGWAVSGQWNKTDFNSTLSLLMRDYYTFPFFNLYVGKDPNEIVRGSTRKYIQIDQPDLLIPTKWCNKTEKFKAITQTSRLFLVSCERYLALLGAPGSNTMHVGLFMSLASELAVAASPLPHRLLKGLLYQRMTIKELQSHAPAIDWLSCLQSAFYPYPVSRDDHVILHNLPYIVHMSQVIIKWLRRRELSSSGPLQTYMVLYLLHTFLPALDSRFTGAHRNFSAALGNPEAELPQWEHCIRETEKGFDTVLTHLVYERTAKREAEEIIQRIFTSFKSKLADLIWKDETSRLHILNKVNSLTPRLQAEIMSQAELSQLFSEVTISTHDYFSNFIQLLSLQQKRRNKLFTTTMDTKILSVTPFLSENELIFPIGMFAPPLFHPSYPRAMNYGVLGFLMAKDILHLLLPDVHSQSETVKTVAECIWTHYLSATEGPGKAGASPLSPAQLQEMWVQHSALQVALQAYQQTLKEHHDDTSISGLSHTRLFLTSFSQVNCDSDSYGKFMPFEPSFMIRVICANSDLCPADLKCPSENSHLIQSC